MNIRAKYSISVNEVYNGDEINGGNNCVISLIAGKNFETSGR